MKRILLFLLVITISATGFTQAQVENPGFEGAWENVPGNEDEPVQWSGLKTSDDSFLANTAPVTAFQETSNPHSGTYCIKLQCVNVISGVNANGLLTNGQVHASFTPSDGYVFTNTSDTQWNTVFTSRPDSLVVWVRHSPASGDKSKVEILLHDNTDDGELPHDGNTANWVGKARVDVLGSLTGWTRLSAPFVYYNNNTPNYLLSVLSAGDSTISVAGTIMWVDDIELVYNPLSVVVNPPASQNINIGVNGTTLTVTETANASVVSAITREWKYSTTSGGPYVSFGSPETGTTYTPNFASAGIYYVICETDFGVSTMMSNEVEIVVVDPASNTVTISPSASQTLLTGQSGNMLTATETPSAANSREWLYSTTSGSGYVSFGTPETGTTYTPNFANLGTYYIICESDFAGDIQQSNEVTIYVPSSAGLQEDEIEFNIYTNGNQINLTFAGTENQTVFSVYTLDGKEIYVQNIIEKNSQHLIDSGTGVYIYRLVSGDKIVTGKIKL